MGQYSACIYIRQNVEFQIDREQRRVASANRRPRVVGGVAREWWRTPAPSCRTVGITTRGRWGTRRPTMYAHHRRWEFWEILYVEFTVKVSVFRQAQNVKQTMKCSIVDAFTCINYRFPGTMEFIFRKSYEWQNLRKRKKLTFNLSDNQNFIISCVNNL